jgi:UDP-glucose 4-epimerase
MNYNNVLVTGGAGYIGSHAVNSLLQSGRNVVVIDRDEKACDSLRQMFKTRKGLKVYCADFSNDIYIDGILANEKIDAVMHFAADASVEESERNPLKYYYNNTAKTIEFLERLIRKGIYRFIFSSTCAVYGVPERPDNITEDTVCRPINAYGNSKLMVEHVLKKMSNSIPAFKYTSFRYFNVAGMEITGKVLDCKWRDRQNVIPLFLQTLMSGKNKVNIFGTDYDTKDGTCVRDYIHPEDIVSAHMIALDDDIEGVYNLGSSDGYSVWNIVENCVAVTGMEMDVNHRPRRNGDPPLLVANSEKFRNLTGWEPNYTLKEMIASAWYSYHKS